MTDESLYRQDALDHLASRDRLETPLALVGRADRLLLVTIVAALAAALAWAVVTRAPVKVSARGILIDRTGLAEIVADDAGRVERLLVAPGDRVRPGQPIARLARVELTRAMADARAEVAGAERRLARLSGYYGGQGAREAGADATHLATIAGTRRTLAAREAYLAEKTVRLATLVDRGFVPRDRLIESQVQLADVRERLANLGEAAIRVRIAANARAGTSGLALLDERRTLDEKRRLLDRLTQRFAEESVVRARVDGRIAELKVGAGDVVAGGTPLATLVPADPRDGLVALLYVPASAGKRIQPGMAAEIVPTTVERATYGDIPSRVVAVAPLPATAEGIRRVLRNDGLVRELMAAGAPIEVRVALARDPRTASGFAWSASRGPDARIDAGSIVDGRVVVERRRVIGWLVPRAGG